MTSDSDPIAPDQPAFYSIIDYTVDGPDTQHEIAEAFVGLQERWVRFHPGFHSARMLASTDGTRLYNLVAWRDEEAFAEFERTSDTEGRIAAIGRVIDGLEGQAEPRMTNLPRYRLLALVEPGPRVSDDHDGNDL